MLGGTDEPFPPIWLAVALVAAVAVGAFFAERVWLSAAPLPDDLDPAEIPQTSVGIFAGQTVRSSCTARSRCSWPSSSRSWPVMAVGPWSSPASPA
ncbi:hypothetical protein [Aeromicrobium sp. UC242_57]|uniref:hypothetical protein n=1 Tax=Aeromicrobium sp. UC242_57 TaxID=3374624 RepID=UPI0037897E91